MTYCQGFPSTWTKLATMTKQAMLGPIDPSVNGPLNPAIPGVPGPNAKVPVSVEYVNAYIEMANKDFGITDQRLFMMI